MFEKHLSPPGAKLHKVTILLSHYCDPFSNFVKLMSRSNFTHASISLDPEEDVFYSFNLKGFIEERWKNKKSKYLLPDRKYIRFYVTEEQYLKLKENLKKFQEKKKELSFTPFGTILCLFRIPAEFKKKYFCSRFVAEMLQNSGVHELKRKATLYLPVHFYQELA